LQPEGTSYWEFVWRIGAIHSSGQTISSFSHIEGITMGAGEEIHEVAGRATHST
jgi:hypothetical protein